MKKTRRFLCLLLTLVLALSLCAIPAAAADTQTRSDDPVVFVHGLFGWGQRDKIFSIMPYWGMTTGSLPDYLATQGYETYAASVGPLSSAWDRACELYAQLVGARTDYGVKHAQDFGHERYGIDAVRRLGHTARREPRRPQLRRRDDAPVPRDPYQRLPGGGRRGQSRRCGPEPVFPRRQGQLGPLADRHRRAAQRHDVH